MTGPQVSEVESVFAESAAIRIGAQRGALLAPHQQSGDQVEPNDPQLLSKQKDADNAFGENSVLSDGFAAARGSGLRRVLLIGVDFQDDGQGGDVDGFDETFGDSEATDSFTLSHTPVTDVSTVEVDGVVADTITFVTDEDTDLDALSPTGNEVFINPDTGEGRAWTDTTGSSTGIIVTYTAHDWTAAFKALSDQNYEYFAPANRPLNFQNYGIYKAFVSEALDENKLIATTLPSAPVFADMKPLVEAFPSTERELFSTAVADYSGDFTSGHFGRVTSSDVIATLKMQDAAGGVTFNEGIKRVDYGPEVGLDGTDTWHEIGVVAVYRKKTTGEFKYSSSRAMTSPSADIRNHYTARQRRFAEEDLGAATEAARELTDRDLSMSEGGLSRFTGVIEGRLRMLQGKGIIADPELDPPIFDELTQDQLKKGIFDRYELSTRLPGQMSLARFELRLRN